MTGKGRVAQRLFQIGKSGRVDCWIVRLTCVRHGREPRGSGDCGQQSGSSERFLYTQIDPGSTCVASTNCRDIGGYQHDRRA